MQLPVELEREVDGRWIAEIPALPGVLGYGPDSATALTRVLALAVRVLAERIEHGETVRGRSGGDSCR